MRLRALRRIDAVDPNPMLRFACIEQRDGIAVGHADDGAVEFSRAERRRQRDK